MNNSNHNNHIVARLLGPICAWYEAHGELVNLAYYLCLTVVLSLEMVLTTMFTEPLINWSGHGWFYRIATVVLSLIVLLRLLPTEAMVTGQDMTADTWREYWIRTALLSMLLVISVGMWLAFNYRSLMIMGLLVVGAIGTSGKRILQIYLTVGVAGVLAMYLASANGYIAYLCYGTTPTHALGGITRTDYAARWLYLFMGYHMLRGRRMRWIEYVVEACLTFYLYHLTEGKTFLLSMAILLGLSYMAQYLPRTTGTRRIGRGVACLGILAYIGCLIASYVLTFTIGRSLQGLDRATIEATSTFKFRLQMSYEAFSKYSIRLFSPGIYEHGYGGQTDWSTGVEYFFLDNAYVRILHCYGVVFLVLLLLALAVVLRRSVREHAWMIWCASVVLAIDSISEHHLSEITYNILPMLLWARWDMDEQHISST